MTRADQKLIRRVLAAYGCGEEQVDQALACADLDPEAAMQSYNRMAIELGLDKPSVGSESFLTADQYLGKTI